MKNDHKFDLGYADFLTDTSSTPKRYRWSTRGLNWAAGLSSYAILKGFGEISDGLSGSLEVVLVIAHILYFLVLIGKGSIDRGFYKLVNFFSNITDYLRKGVNRIAANILPFAVNIGILCFLFPWMVWGIYMFSHFFLVTDFLERFNVLNSLGGGDALFGFFKDKAIVPFVISASAIVMNWTFFNEND